jgi:hypothetical protein
MDDYCEVKIFLLQNTSTVSTKMNVGVTTSYANPNSVYFNSKGMWLTYIIIVGFVHYVLLSLPFLSVAMAWTLTNVIHNVVSSFCCHNRRARRWLHSKN